MKQVLQIWRRVFINITINCGGYCEKLLRLFHKCQSVICTPSSYKASFRSKFFAIADYMEPPSPHRGTIPRCGTKSICRRPLKSGADVLFSNCWLRDDLIFVRNGKYRGFFENNIHKRQTHVNFFL